MKLYPDEARTPKIPMNSSYNLRLEQPNPDNASLLPVTGKLRYICDRTRPDILLATGEISTGGSNAPSNNHVKVAKQIHSYLKGTKDMKLTLGGRGLMKHFAFCDASYVTQGKSKSRLGHCQFLGMDSGAIDCVSVNDTTVSHSSMEAEIKALDLCILSVMYTRNVLSFMGYEQSTPTTIFCDNKSAIELCKTLKQTNKSRHIQMRINFVRECINAGICEIVFVPTDKNVADVLTKPLPDEPFHRHIGKIMYGFNNSLDDLLTEKVSYVEVVSSIHGQNAQK
jgi:hypothetical protein